MTNQPHSQKPLLYILNVDWYFNLHWIDRALAAKNHNFEIHLACEFTEQKYRELLEQQGINCHPIKLSRTGKNPLKDLQTFTQLYNLITKLNPTVIHTATVKPNIYGGLIAKLTRTPVVSTVTGLGSVFSKKNIGNKLLGMALLTSYKLIFRTPKCSLLFENNSDYELFKSKSIGSRRIFKVSGSGVDTEIYQPSREQLNDCTTVLFAGRLIKEKGLQNLVEAISQIKTRHKIVLKIAGIEDKNACNPIPSSTLKSWDQIEHINFLGQVDDMPSLMKELDIVCLPTLYREGIPRVLIEAGASGKPSIGSKSSGCEDLIKDGTTGYLIDPKSAKDLTDTLEKLILDEKLRLRMGQAAREHVKSHFSKEKVILEHINIYKDLLTNNK